MLKQLLINQAVASYDLLNLPQQTIRIIYNTHNKTFKLIDTYNGIQTEIISNGQIAVSQTILQQLEQIEQKIKPLSKGALFLKGKVETKEELPTTDVHSGDVYLVGSQEEYVYIEDPTEPGIYKEENWVLLGQEISLKANKEEVLELADMVHILADTVNSIREILINVKDNTNDIQYMISKVNSIV